MAPKFQRPNLPNLENAPEAAALGQVGQTLQTLPMLYAQYRQQKMEQEFKNKQLQQQISQFDTTSGLAQGKLTEEIRSNKANEEIKGREKPIPRYAIPSYDKEGNITGYSEVPEGMKPFGGGKPTGTGTQEKQKVAYKQKASQLDSGLATIEQLESAFNRIKEQGKTGKSFKTLTSAAMGKLEEDPDVKAYQALRVALIAFIGRNIGADVGNFAAKEAEYYKGIMPSQFANAETAQRLFDEMKLNIKQKKDAVNKVYSSVSPEEEVVDTDPLGLGF